MSIDFSGERWYKIKHDYADWWEGRLDRPLIYIELSRTDPGRPKPVEPMHEVTACYEFSIPPEVIIDHWDYQLSRKKYIGDAFPNIRPNFGAGVNAAFMGAAAKPTEETVWFESEGNVFMEDLHFEYNPDHPWLKRIKDICRAGSERWQGSVCIAMTDLNNGIDPVARFFSGTDMILALYDMPEEVKRLTWKSSELTWMYYDEINAVVEDANPGYTCWGSIFSAVPHFMLQSDFSAMISPSMFEEFILPELQACCKRIPHSFYHLDGPGQLPHLDMILSIPELRGVQWIPGAGQKDERHWPEVYRKILDAGKLIQVFGNLDTLDAIAERLGTTKGIYLQGIYENYDIAQEDEVMKRLERYRVY